MATFAIVACNDVETDTFPEPEPPVETIEVESVEVAPTTIELAIGEETQLSASVLPVDAQYTLEWISTNDDVVTVADGVVKGIASGTAIVMAKAGNRTGSCTVSVVGVPVESITLNYHELELEERGVYTLSATVLPEVRHIPISSQSMVQALLRHSARDRLLSPPRQASVQTSVLLL